MNMFSKEFYEMIGVCPMPEMHFMAKDLENEKEFGRHKSIKTKNINIKILSANNGFIVLQFATHDCSGDVIAKYIALNTSDVGKIISEITSQHHANEKKN